MAGTKIWKITNNLGKVIKIIATLPNKQPSSIELEVMR